MLTSAHDATLLAHNDGTHLIQTLSTWPVIPILLSISQCENTKWRQTASCLDVTRDRTWRKTIKDESRSKAADIFMIESYSSNFFKNRTGVISGVRASIPYSSPRRTLSHDTTFVNFVSENYDALSIFRRRDAQSRAIELRNVAFKTVDPAYKDIKGTEYFASL
jgi:hypothetical protein